MNCNHQRIFSWAGLETALFQNAVQRILWKLMVCVRYSYEEVPTLTFYTIQLCTAAWKGGTVSYFCFSSKELCQRRNVRCNVRHKHYTADNKNCLGIGQRWRMSQRLKVNVQRKPACVQYLMGNLSAVLTPDITSMFFAISSVGSRQVCTSKRERDRIMLLFNRLIDLNSFFFSVNDENIIH